MSNVKDLSRIEWTGKTLAQLRPLVRKMPKLEHMTKVLDTEVGCTVCRSAVTGRPLGWTYRQDSATGQVFKTYCPCCAGTRVMLGRTSEEHYNETRGQRR